MKKLILFCSFAACAASSSTFTGDVIVEEGTLT